MSFILLGILNQQAAGGGAGAYDYLDTVRLASPTATIDLANLDAYSDYKHLEFRMSMRNTDSGGALNIGFNDTYATGPNVSWEQWISESGQNPSGSPWDNVESLRTDYNSNYSGDPGTYYGASRLLITDVHSTSKLKSFHYEHATRMNTILYRRDYDGVFNSTDPLTKLTIFKTSGSFQTFSQIDVYGYRGA